MQSMDSGGMYNVTPVWTKLKSGAWTLNGLKVVLSPSQCLVGHDTLPLNDMNSARLLAFVMLMEMWVEHFDDNPLIEYFDVYNATLANLSLAFYSVFPSSALARTALLRATPLWDSKFKVKNHNLDTQVCPAWRVEFPEHGCLKVSLGDALPYWHRYINSAVSAMPSSRISKLRAYSQRILIAEMDLYEQYFKNSSNDPVEWYLPEIDGDNFYLRRVNELLQVGDKCPLKFTDSPRLPKSILAQTFNRQTATAYIDKVWLSDDEN